MKSQATLLVIDDEETFRVVMSRELERCGYLVRMAASGEAGVAAAGDEVDVALLDLRLPDMDGLEVLRRLRARPATASTPCVAVSAHALPAEIERARVGGFEHYWVKPLDGAEFLAGVDALLERAGTHSRGAA
jgi:CheY-like chemotaxis protein